MWGGIHFGVCGRSPWPFPVALVDELLRPWLDSVPHLPDFGFADLSHWSLLFALNTMPGFAGWIGAYRGGIKPWSSF